ncbi:hypothetical protein [Novosphingobium pentaromativorans]|nr:hypothetical protein [Novosphingobium pentaromativorans]
MNVFHPFVAFAPKKIPSYRRLKINPASKKEMTMKRIFFVTALATGLAMSPAMAQQAQHQHDSSHTEAAGQPDKDAGMMMGSAAMQEHRQKMEEMRALMQQARAATNPAERQRLMAEHRQKMQEHMARMMQGDQSAMMQACHERMMMMHDMMEQMAAQQSATPSK